MNRDETHSNSDERRAQSIPVLTLGSAVLFPGVVLSLQMPEEAVPVRGGGPGGDEVVAVFRSSLETTRAESIPVAAVGVRATIVQRLAIGGARCQIVLQAGERVIIDRIVDPGPELPLEAFVTEIRPPPTVPRASEDRLVEKLLLLLEELVEVDGRYSEDVIGVASSSRAHGAGRVADLVANYLQVPLEDKYSVLETLDPVDRLTAVTGLIQRDLRRAMLDREVEREAQISIASKDRERYLREQIRVIQDELGEGGSDTDLEEYAERIELLPVDDDWKTLLKREATRMGQLPPGSSDYSVIRGHLDTVLQMPWSLATRDRIDLEEAETLLEANHHGLREVKERVLEFLAVVKLKGDLRGPILCFAGPPGVGKTSLGESIARALGRKFIRLSVGGMTDESEIRGHRKTYVGSMPGKIVNGYLQAAVNNPLVMIDEIDKVGKDFRGDPASSLLEVLDPEQNRRFVDRYLEVPFDLSHTLFIVTANVLDDIPGPLRDRLEIIRLAGYTETEKLQIAKRHLVPGIVTEHGLREDRVAFDDDAMLSIIREYTAEAGVRELSRKISSIARKAARAVASGRDTAIRVTTSNLPDFLGIPVYECEFAQRAPEIGVATGLAWTTFGGEILFIEATRMEGSGKTIVTGHLGDVMKESVQTAYSYVRSRARELGIADDAFDRSDLHVHFPAGAIRKDGPSAGVAIATTIASLMAERPIRHDVAMTGELTLRGKVLSVGGIKEKVIAARRARIGKVILPMGNRKDLSEVEEEVKADLEFVFAERVEDVWKEALIPVFVVAPERRRKYDEAEFAADRARDSHREQP
jgi:ATP-dependent Lon protease